MHLVSGILEVLGSPSSLGWYRRSWSTSYGHGSAKQLTDQEPSEEGDDENVSRSDLKDGGSGLSEVSMPVNVSE